MKCALVRLRLALDYEVTPKLVCSKFDIDDEDFDYDFGVIEAEAEKGLYTIRVREPIADALRDRDGVVAVLPDPEIGP